MNINQASSLKSRASSQEISLPDTAADQEERIYFLGMETLDDGKDVSSSELSSKLIAPTPVVKKGVVEIIKIFFKRYATPTLEDQEQANKIIGAKQKLERQLDKIDAFTRKMQVEEKRLKSQFPSLNSLQKAAIQQAEFNQLLANAQSMLDDLESQEATTKSLADAYVWYEHVPTQIESIKEHVSYLQGRAKVSQALIMLERSLVAYGEPGQQPFAQFSSILENKDRLISVIKETIGQNPALTEDSEIQKFLRTDDLSAYATYKVISVAYPGLKGQVERLFDAISSAKDQRIDLLKAKTHALDHLVKQYNSKAAKISELERRLYYPTTMDGIKHFFTTPKDIKREIAQIKLEFEQIHAVFLDKGYFDLQENAWIEKLGRRDPAYQTLSKNVKAIQQHLSLIEERKQFSDKMDRILDDFETYAKEAKTIKKLDPNRKTVQTRIKAQKELKQEIAARFQELVSIMRVVEEKQADQETSTEDLNSFESLKKLAVTRFPKLENRFEKIAQFIKAHSFQTEIEQSIQQREVPTSETPPAPSPVNTPIETRRRPLTTTPKTATIVPVLPPILDLNHSDITTYTPLPGAKKKQRPIVKTRSAPSSPTSGKRKEDVSVIPTVINRLNSNFGKQEEETVDLNPPPPALASSPTPKTTPKIPQPPPPPPPPIVQHTQQSKIKIERNAKINNLPPPSQSEVNFETILKTAMNARRDQLHEDGNDSTDGEVEEIEDWE
jgi:hypothetical protein